MSKLDELINELCPDGVEYVRFNDVLDYEQPTKYIVEKIDYSDSFDTPVLTAGQTFILGYTNETDGIYNATKESPAIIFDDFTTSFHWVNFNFKIKSSAMKILRVKSEKVEDVSFRFLYHCMKSIKYIPVDHSRQWIEKYSQKQFPLPPLQVQKEIVRILDNFVELTKKLTNKLREELLARKKQYEYYRDSLLTFDNEVLMVPLNEIATIVRGGNFQKKDFVETGVPCIHYGQIYTKYGLTATKSLTFIDEFVAAKSKFAQKNDIIMAVTSENVEDVCKCVVWLGEEDVAVSGHTAIIKHNQNPKFLAYYFNTTMFFKDKIKLCHGTKVIEVTPSKIADIKIPLPPLLEQQRIVDILDRFDALCNDITNRLPAEIKARQQQYEYYRDKLLSFPKAELEV